MKDKNNIVKIVIMIVGILLVCALCFFASESSTKKKGDSYQQSNNSATGGSGEDAAAQAREESDKVAENEKKDFTDITMDEYLELYKGEENKVVLFSRPTCGYCQIAEPILQNIAYRKDITIHHLNTDEFSSEDEEKLVKSDDYFSGGFGTPLLVVVSDSKIVDAVSGLTNTANYEAFFTKYGFIK